MHNYNIQSERPINLLLIKILRQWKKNLRSIHTGERLNTIWSTWMKKHYFALLLLKSCKLCWATFEKKVRLMRLVCQPHCCHKKSVTQKQSVCSNHQWGTQHTKHAGVMQGQTRGQGRHASAHSVARKRRQSNCTEIYCTIFPIHNLHPIPSRTNTLRHVTLSSDSEAASVLLW